MIYFVSGLSSRNIYINKLIEKSKMSNKIFFNEDSVSEFLSELNAGSLFSEPNLLILKNANKVKDIQKILKNISENEYDKDVIIDYECNKENKKIKEITKNFNFFEILDEKENRKILLKYITKNLNCGNMEANYILDIVGDNFFNIKNEIDKISAYSNGEVLNMESINNIISKNTNFLIFNITNDILNKKNIEFPIKEHMAILSSLINDFEIMYKLHVLGITKGSYNSLKTKISKYETFNNYSPYYVFKKIEYLKNFSKDKILELLEEAFNTENNIKNGIIPLEEGIETFILKIIS